MDVTSHAHHHLPAHILQPSPAPTTVSSLAHESLDNIRTHVDALLTLAEGLDDGKHPLMAPEQRREAATSLRNFLADKNDTSHAYVNGLLARAEKLDLLAARDGNTRPRLKICVNVPSRRCLVENITDQRVLEKHAPVPLHVAEYGGDARSTSAHLVSETTASLASSQDSADSGLTSLEDTENISAHSSFATSIRDILEEPDIVLTANGDDLIEGHGHNARERPEVAAGTHKGIRSHGVHSGDGRGAVEPRANAKATPPSRPSGKRARQHNQQANPGDDEDDEDDDDDRDDSKRPRTAENRVASLKKKFACPFFKHDQQRYADCAYTAVKDYEAVKRHLTDKHSEVVPIGQCEKCRFIFEKTHEIKAHHKDDTGKCDPAKYGGTPRAVTTHEVLRSEVDSETDEGKWGEMYRLLFPGTHSTPLPYNRAYEHILDSDVIGTVEQCASGRVPQDCLDVMASCFPHPACPIQRQIALNLATVLSGHIISKRPLALVQAAGTDTIVGPDIDQCQMRCVQLFIAWQNQNRNQVIPQWIAVQDRQEVQRPLSSGNLLEPSMARYDSQPSAFPYDSSMHLHGDPFADSGYGTGPNTDEF